jgi:hypothetical protein
MVLSVLETVAGGAILVLEGGDNVASERVIDQLIVDYLSDPNLASANLLEKPASGRTSQKFPRKPS